MFSPGLPRHPLGSTERHGDGDRIPKQIGDVEHERLTGILMYEPELRQRRRG